MKNIAIIPARGGSKRIPRKNIKDFMGKPIIAYSIQAALQSNLFDEVMVSTEDKEIASIAQQYGADVPFLRSAETSNDYATTVDVLNEVLCEYAKRGQHFDYMSCIYATAPFITAKRLKQAYVDMIEHNYDGCYPIVQYSYPIQRCLVSNNGIISRKWSQYENSRSQDLEPTYHDAGQFYFYKVDAFNKKDKILNGIILSELEVQDLDTETDWQIAELKYKLLQNKIRQK